MRRHQPVSLLAIRIDATTGCRNAKTDRDSSEHAQGTQRRRRHSKEAQIGHTGAQHCHRNGHKRVFCAHDGSPTRCTRYRRHCDYGSAPRIVFLDPSNLALYLSQLQMTIPFYLYL